MMKDKIVAADEAIALIRNGDSVSCSGFVGIGTPEELLAALERRFIATQSPRDSRSCSRPRLATGRIAA